MKVCKAFQTARRQWRAKYKNLEKQYAEAIQQEQWERAERLGDKLVDLESNSARSHCSCRMASACRFSKFLYFACH